MKKHKVWLWITLSCATAIVVPFMCLVQKQPQKPIPYGWHKTLITIKNIESLDSHYAYTLTYSYQTDEKKATIEQYILDDRKPKNIQKIAALYCQAEPVLFELLAPIQYE